MKTAHLLWTCEENAGEQNTKAMQYKQTSKKKRGRPKTTWFDGIRDAMEKKRLEEEQSLDSPRWREILENGR